MCVSVLSFCDWINIISADSHVVQLSWFATAFGIGQFYQVNRTMEHVNFMKKKNGEWKWTRIKRWKAKKWTTFNKHVCILTVRLERVEKRTINPKNSIYHDANGYRSGDCVCDRTCCVFTVHLLVCFLVPSPRRSTTRCVSIFNGE